MAIISWQKEYSVEIQELDEQHKMLINIINELYEALAGDHQEGLVEELMERLVEYSKVHFAVEESLMRIFHYPQYAEHKEIHDDILIKLMSMQTRYKKGESNVGMELLQFLRDWLITHILEVDKHYSEHFVKQGVKKSWLKKFW